MHTFPVLFLGTWLESWKFWMSFNFDWKLVTFPHAVGVVDLEDYNFINQPKIVCEVYSELLYGQNQ